MVKRTLFSLIGAALLTLVVYLGLQMHSSGPDVFSLIILPFYIISSLVSGNPHEPNEAIGYTIMFAFFFCAVFACQVLWSKLRRGR